MKVVKKADKEGSQSVFDSSKQIIYSVAKNTCNKALVSARFGTCIFQQMVKRLMNWAV